MNQHPDPEALLLAAMMRDRPVRAAAPSPRKRIERPSWAECHDAGMTLAEACRARRQAHGTGRYWARKHGLKWPGTMPPVERDPLRAQVIIAIAAMDSGVPASVIVGPSKKAAAVAARRVAILRLRAAGYSLPGIGRLLNRDHTTILAAVRGAARRGETA